MSRISENKNDSYDFYQQYFHSTNDVHGRRNAGAQVEENPDGSSELRTQVAGDEEVGAAPRYHPVRCYGAHWYGCCHRLQKVKKVTLSKVTAKKVVESSVEQK